MNSKIVKNNMNQPNAIININHTFDCERRQLYVAVFLCFYGSTKNEAVTISMLISVSSAFWGRLLYLLALIMRSLFMNEKYQAIYLFQIELQEQGKWGQALNADPP